jgi:hypothetical protein
VAKTDTTSANENPGDNATPAETEPVAKKGPFGRPLKPQPAPAPAPQVAPPAPPASGQSLIARMMRAATTSGRRAPMDPAVLQQKRDERMRHITAVLEAVNAGRDHRPEDYIKQIKFEAAAIANGSWFPGMMRPRGAGASIAEQIMGVPGTTPTREETAAESRVDALLES